METNNQLMAALVAAQAEAQNIPRNALAQAGSRQYRYATLDSLRDMARPILAKHGLALVGRIEQDGIRWVVAHKSGESMEWHTPWPGTVGNPQLLGGLVTYLTRYQLALLLGVAAEDDDDAQAATQAAAEATRPSQQPSQPKDPERSAALNELYSAFVMAGADPRDKRVRDRAVLEYFGEPRGLNTLTPSELRDLAAYVRGDSAPKDDTLF